MNNLRDKHKIQSMYTIFTHPFQLRKYLHVRYNYMERKEQKDHHLVDHDENQVRKIHKIDQHSREDNYNVQPNQQVHRQHREVQFPI